MAHRIVVITGASSGIGEALAKELGRRGDKLVLAARRKSELDRVAKDCGAPALVVPTDVTKREEIERLRDQALEAYGHIDVWVNNAGRGISQPVLKLTDEDVDEMVSVNVKSALYGIQAVVPHFQERRKGHLINVSSFLGRVPVAPIRSVYSASKAMLNSLTSNLRMELKGTPGIAISTVMPGIVSTEFAKNVLHSAPPAGANFVPTGPMAPQTATEVAVQIAELIDSPKPELYTNPAHPGIARRYFEDVGAFESGMGGPPGR